MPPRRCTAQSTLMGETVIPLADLRYTAPVPAIPAQAINNTNLSLDA